MSGDPEARVREVLSHIDPNCERAVWWKICAGVKNELGDAGFDAFDEWSSGGKSYNATATRSTWKSLKEMGGTTFATVVDIAKKDHGYVPKRGAFKKPTQDELEAREQKYAARMAVHQAEKAKEAAEAAARATKRWGDAASRPASPDHPYLKKKGVLPHGLRMGPWPVNITVDGIDKFESLDNVLYIPMRDKKKNNNIHSLQGITVEGKKLFLSGGVKKGHFYPLGAPKIDPDTKQPTFVFAEGFATGASIHESTRDMVFCCFDLGNMVEVVKQVRAARPDAVLIIAADNDTETPGNPGMTRATAAAIEYGARLATCPPGDFNDLYLTEGGAERVQEAFAEATIPTEPFAAPGAVSAGLAAADMDADKSDPVTVPEIEDYPCWRVFDEPVWHENKRYHGTYFFGLKESRGEKSKAKPFDVYVCGPLRIVAQTHAADEKHSFGRLLRWKNSTGKWQEWAMPAKMMAADPKEARAALLDQGLEINPDAYFHLKRWLGKEVGRLDSVHCVQQTGWTSDAHDAFVLPSKSLGPKATKVVLQVELPEVDPYEHRGNLKCWRERVAGVAPGNTALTLGLSIAFSGPLNDIVGAESGGVHMWGDSSTGKSTIYQGGCSVWGFHKRFGKSWRTTSNGLEGAAAHRNDTLLALDEIGQCDSAHLGDIVYLLGNGTGRQRANVTGAARAVKSFRVAVLSTGEMSVSAALEKGGVRIRAGQEVRVIDLSMVGRAHGVWDDLRQHATGAEFTKALKDATDEHYGHAGPEFVQQLARLNHDALRARYADLKVELAGHASSAQAGRVAQRMAAYALAGELATEFGLTGWTPGWATEATAAELKLWQKGRSTKGQGNAEPHQIMQAVVDFVQKHGESRFDSFSGSSTERYANDRAGWRRQEAGKDLQYLFTSAGIREATKGFDLSRVVDVLNEIGALIKQKSQESMGKHTIIVKAGGGSTAVYAINYETLQAALNPVAG